MLRIIYIASTLFVVIFLGLVGGIMDIIQGDAVIAVANKLGYPLYFFSLLGLFKILGALSLLLPKRIKSLKTMAYSGFAFDLIFAAFSHFSVKSPIIEVAIPLFILIILLLSVVLRKDYSLYDKDFKNNSKIS